MNLRDLKYFISVAELKHFGKAAEACHISQPTLSTQLKKLEEQWGIQVFERNPKQVLLTPAGVDLAEQAKNILREVATLLDIAQKHRDPLSGPLKVGMMPTVATYLLPKIMPALPEALPKVQLFLIEEKTHVLIEKLQSGAIDMAILALPLPQDNFQTTVLYEEPFYVALPDTHPFASQPSLDLADLTNEPWLLLEEGHCLRDTTLSLCHEYNLQESKGFKGSNLETLKYMVTAGNGITLLPALMRSSPQPENLKFIPIAPQRPHRQIVLAWRKYSPKTACAEKIIELTRAITAPLLT